MGCIPITYVLFTLQSLRDERSFIRSCRALANYAIAAVYCLFSVYCSYYMITNYVALGTERMGMWDPADLIVGGVMTLLIIEYARKRHMPLFILNIILVLYAVYGYVVPGMFYHAGLSWVRVIAASSVEMETGIFSRLPQIALTVIGSFLLVLSLLRGFGCVDSLLRATKRVAIRSPHAIPQSAVIGSMAIGTVSGSGAANSITVGSATIPAMIQAGLPPATAAAIENSSSMGGQLMPPVMGIAAFLMAEFLGVDYFDVVARGWVPALIYYISVSTSVYLLATFYHTHMIVDLDRQAARLARQGQSRRLRRRGRRPGDADGDHLSRADVCRALHVLRGRLPGCWSSTSSSLLRQLVVPRVHRAAQARARFLYRHDHRHRAAAGDAVDHDRRAGDHRRADQARLAAGRRRPASTWPPWWRMAFLFGAILGTGLPPAPVYILVAIVIGPPFIKVGVNPWVVHFFAFFIGVFGELTPPTSITAAITSKIANASFYTTLWRSVQICVSLFTLMAGVFVHPELVIKPGLDQMGAAYLVLVATLGITFTLQATYSETRIVDLGVRGGARRDVALHPVLVQRHRLRHRVGRGLGRDRLLDRGAAKDRRQHRSARRRGHRAGARRRADQQ